jgi:hypothetical protein
MHMCAEAQSAVMLTPLTPRCGEHLSPRDWPGPMVPAFNQSFVIVALDEGAVEHPRLLE